MRRIFLGPVEIAGYYHNLAQGFKELGIPCDHICYFKNKNDYKQEEVGGIILPLIRRLNQNQKPFQKIIVAICVEFLAATFLRQSPNMMFSYLIWMLTSTENKSRFIITQKV